MSETTKSRPRPYIEQRPGNQILASDWNDMQVQIREEIAATLAEVGTLREELLKLEALRKKVAEEVAALQSEVTTARLSVSGGAAIQGDAEVQGTIRGGSARFAGIAIGRAAHGKIDYSYESLQLRPEHNLRLWFGSDERYVFHNSGVLQASALKVNSLQIGDFRLDGANGWLRIIGAGDKVIAQFSAVHGDRMVVYRDANAGKPYLFYNSSGTLGQMSSSGRRGLHSQEDGTVEIHHAQGKWAFQSDGNLVRYNGHSRASWDSGHGW